MNWTLRQHIALLIPVVVLSLGVASVLMLDLKLDDVLGAALGCLWLPAMGALVIGTVRLCVSLAESTSDSTPAQPRVRVSPFSGRCRVCDYDLTGIKDRCPECGSPFNRAPQLIEPGLFAGLQARTTRSRVRQHATAWLVVFVLSNAFALILLWTASGRGSPARGQELFVGVGLPWLVIISIWCSWILWHWDDDS